MVFQHVQSDFFNEKLSRRKGGLTHRAAAFGFVSNTYKLVTFSGGAAIPFSIFQGALLPVLSVLFPIFSNLLHRQDQRRGGAIKDVWVIIFLFSLPSEI
jgi:hypothetical protein